MYANRPWTIRQYAGFSTAEESNAFYRRNLAAGQMGLSVAFDLATHRGYDSDHPRVVGDVGKAGVAIDSVEDMKILFDGIPLDKMSVSMTMNGAVLPVLACFVVAGEEQGVGQDQLSGTIQNDILKEFMVRNTYIYPPEPSMRIVADIIELHGAATCRSSTRSRSPATTCRRPGRRPCRSSPSPSPTASSTCAPPSTAASTSTRSPAASSFFFAIGMNFFMEVAKLRAARLLWHRVMRAVRPEEAALADAAHALPDVGRVAHRAGPVQQHRAHHRSRRWPRCSAARRACTPTPSTRRSACPPTSRARIARNTQLILAEETGVTHVVDPLGGSYYVEALTQDLADEAWALIEEVEALGGMTKAVESGMPKLRIEEAAARRQARVDRGEEVDRRRQQVPSPRTPTTSTSATSTTPRCASSRSPGSSRSGPSATTRGVRGRARGAARGRRAATATCSRSAIDAARARATVGEISDALEEVFGRHRAEIRTIAGVYGAAYEGDEDFEAVQARRRARSPRPRAAGPASSSSRWARTATTAAPR